MNTRKILSPEIKGKFLSALNQWANDFKIIGDGGNETPRYSQIMRHPETDEIVLKSTQKLLFYEVDLTEKEREYMNMVQRHEYTELWNEWKGIRTNFLKQNHPTIPTI